MEASTLNEGKANAVCLSCERTDDDIPLVSLTYRGTVKYICPECLPTLIHHSERLAAKIVGS
jgi:hypothetical protein